MLRTCELSRARAFFCAALAIVAVSSVSPSYARPDARVLASAKKCEPKARALLQQLVQIDSGTGDVAGLAAMGAILKTELESLGDHVETVPAVAPACGDNVVAALTGTGKRHVLLIAQMYKVVHNGTVSQLPYRVVGDSGIGPGAGDDKARIVTAACALRILHELNSRDYALITLILNTNEETGSVRTRDLTRAQ